MPILTLIMPLLTKILDFIPNPQERQERLMEIINALQQADAAQNQVNLEEAKSSNLFVAGGRPFIIWVCGIAFAYKFVLQPFIIFLMVAFGSSIDYHKLPNMDWADLSPVMMSLLGLGGMRTYEKIQGVSK